MKKVTVMLAFAATMLIAGTGCNQNDDDNDDDTPNGFTYDGVFYDAELLGIFVFQQNTYDIRIEISTGTGWNATDQQVTGGPFDMVRLDAVNYVDGNPIGVGNYVFSASATTPGTISGDSESFWLNFDPINWTSDPAPQVINGSLNVSKDGSEYTLDYSLTMSNGKTITGHYKGELDYVYQS